jgi:flagellar biosynthesis protein FlhG
MNDQMAALRRLMAHERRRMASEGAARQAPDLFVLAVASGKGGVGKTLCAGHLAAGLARRGHRTLLVEGDLRMADLHLLFDGASTRRMAHGPSPPLPALSQIVDERNALSEQLFSPMPNLDVLAPAAMTLEENECVEAYFHRVLFFARSPVSGARFLIIDAASGMPAEHVPLFAAADGVLLLTSLEMASITDAYVLMKLLYSAGVEAEISLVPSMVASGLQAAELHEKFNLIAEKFLHRRVASWGYLPFDASLPAAAAEGHLLWGADPGSAYLGAMIGLVDHVCARVIELTGAGRHVAR